MPREYYGVTRLPASTGSRRRSALERRGRHRNAPNPGSLLPTALASPDFGPALRAYHFAGIRPGLRAWNWRQTYLICTPVHGVVMPVMRHPSGRSLPAAGPWALGMTRYPDKLETCSTSNGAGIRPSMRFRVRRDSLAESHCQSGARCRASRPGPPAHCPGHAIPGPRRRDATVEEMKDATCRPRRRVPR